MRTKTRLIEKGDFTFYNITDIKLEVDAKKMTTQFDNLFGGNNKEIERSTNESFNKNWRDFFEALRPLITDTVNKIMSDLLPPLFLMYPANFFVGDVPTSQKLYGTKEWIIIICNNKLFFLIFYLIFWLIKKQQIYILEWMKNTI